MLQKFVNRFTIFGVQLPDDLLSQAVIIIDDLKQQFPDKQFYVLADTSYGSCCADEVAAQHVDAEAIIHYGEACMSASTRLPIYYCLGTQEVDYDKLDEVLADIYDFVLVPSAQYNYAISQLQGYPTACINELIVEPGSQQNKFCGRSIPSDKALVYVGQQNEFLTALLMTYNQQPVYSFDPSTHKLLLESPQVNKKLMRRYYLVEKTKSEDIIGILVGTLAVGSYGQVINKLLQLIRSKDKKPFILSVGKLNTAKLANFPEVTVFVNVACPLSSLVEDQKDYLQDIITPLELEMALNNKDWNVNGYTLDFSQVDLEPLQTSEDSDQEETVFSLASGRYTERPQRKRLDVEGALVKSEAGSLVQTMKQVVIDRSWNGLDINESLKPVTRYTEGKSGIARNYTQEQL